MNAAKWLSVLACAVGLHGAGCAADGDAIDDDEVAVDDDEAADLAPAQDNAPTPTTGGGSCNAKSGTNTISGGTYSTDDDGSKWCCKDNKCIECGGANTCTSAKKIGVVAPIPGGGVLAP